MNSNFSREDVSLVSVNPPGAVRISNRSVTAAILTTEEGAEVGVAFLRRYQLEKYKGLDLLTRFPVPHRVIAGRPGLDATIASAFQAAFLEEKASPSETQPGDELDWEESATFGVVPVDEAYLEMVRKMMRDAARFDGEPDPFPPNPKPPVRGL